MKSLRGSLNEVHHPERGASSWLNEIRMASSELASTAERLSNETVLRIRNWPSPANSVMVAEIRRWWSISRRAGRVESTRSTTLWVKEFCGRFALFEMRFRVNLLCRWIRIANANGKPS